MVKKFCVFVDCFATVKVFRQVFAHEYYESLYKLVTTNIFCGMRVDVKQQNFFTTNDKQYTVCSYHVFVVVCHVYSIVLLSDY